MQVVYSMLLVPQPGCPAAPIARCSAQPIRAIAPTQRCVPIRENLA
ncbi:hypothetical protein M3B90_07490 [Dermabacter sp. p3-SID358]|nr:hypothetical protein [Dermabacter sp. p3-SID358]MCT1867366.1 hypothetical protein [Dermabacter sp. p3-SID358]